jgi:RNA polymerase sigma factor (sigma-70 family)
MDPLPHSQAAAPIPAGGTAALDVAAPRRLPLPLPALWLLSDERLARLASAGDRAAFGVIFRRYHQELQRYCLSILRNADDAGDALQSTMLRALNSLEGDPREIALRPWLHRIAHNESITLLRRHRRSDTDARFVPAHLDGEASADVRAQVGELMGDLREIPERQQRALVMRELGGLGYAEIASVLDTTPAGAKQATYEARRTLHELAKGREMACALVCTAVSDGDGRALRGRALRAHLRACGDCRDFLAASDVRQSRLAALAPAMPSAAAGGFLESALGGGGGIGGAGLFTGVGVSAALKALTALAVVAALGAGTHLGGGPGGSAHRHRAAPAPRSSVPTLPARPAHRAPPSSPRVDGRRGGPGVRGTHGIGRAGGSRRPAPAGPAPLPTSRAAPHSAAPAPQSSAPNSTPGATTTSRSSRHTRHGLRSP